MRVRYLYLLVLPLLFLSASLAGCDSLGDQGTSSTFKIYLTDAPGDFERAVVTIDSILLYGEGGSVLLRDEPATVDLLTLQNEVFELVEQLDVPSGVYSEIRLVISGGFIEVEQADGSHKIYASSSDYAAENGVTADGYLQMPSYQQSGLKVNLPGGSVTVDGDQHIILLDFVVSESFGQQAGASEMWVMTPVIHASDFTLTGAIELTLALGDDVDLPSEDQTLADFSAELDKGGDTITVEFADVDGNGIYKATFLYLNPGEHDVAILAPEGVEFTSERASPLSFVISNGSTEREEVTITSAEASEEE